ncbi:hypothetical protein [Oleiharenicola sp. Vm1]|uniref:hypothetical protein n=1 Tax=Oleiharenicola sp. Vm1 TaxID=3398393 RepID=UPI0039F6061E
MELNLHPLATKCYVSGREFAEGDRVVCYLVREADGLTGRRDLLESEDANLEKPAEVYCRWVLSYKPRKGEENADRTLKMTAENLFVTLADPLNPPNDANTPLLQFLALMLERKKILKPRGQTPDGARNIFEHARTHQMYEIPVGDLNAEFFVQIQGKLDVLVGAPKKKAEPAVSASDAMPPADAPAPTEQA